MILSIMIIDIIIMIVIIIMMNSDSNDDSNNNVLDNCRSMCHLSERAHLLDVATWYEHGRKQWDIKSL